MENKKNENIKVENGEVSVNRNANDELVSTINNELILAINRNTNFFYQSVVDNLNKANLPTAVARTVLENVIHLITEKELNGVIETELIPLQARVTELEKVAPDKEK